MVLVDPAEDGRSSPDALSEAWSRPPGPVFHAAAATALLLVVWGSTYPAVWPPAVLIAGPALVLLVVIWSVRTGVHLWARARGWGSGRSRQLLLFPALAAPAVVLLLAGLPFDVRWALSERSFARADQLARTTPLDELNQKPAAVQRIGLYRVDFVYRTGTGVYFRESGARLFESAGFACLDRPPQARVVEGRAYTLIGGCWYTWTRSTVDDD